MTDLTSVHVSGVIRGVLIFLLDWEAVPSSLTIHCEGPVLYLLDVLQHGIGSAIEDTALASFLVNSSRK